MRSILLSSILLAGSLVACATDEAPDASDDSAGCTGGKCDAFGGSEVLSTFTDVTTNPDTYFHASAKLSATKAVFFTSNVKGLWVTDGTAAGTKLVRDFPDPVQVQKAPGAIAVLNGKGYFIYRSALYVTDGTAAGTAMVFEVPPAGNQYITDVYSFGGKLWFSSSGSAVNAFYSSDGTTAGTTLFANMSAAYFTTVGSSMYFYCNIPATGGELCVSDGTVGGTRVVKDLKPGTGSVSPRILGKAGSRVVFIGQGGTSALWSLYASDGTDAGTVKLLNELSNDDVVGQYGEGTELDSKFYVPCNTPDKGNEMCVTDGTVAGTSVLDLYVGATGSGPSKPEVAGGKMYFQATSQTAGRELWVSNGTQGGSSVIVDSNPTGDPMIAPYLVPFGNAMLFQARGAGFGHQSLWRTDGTAAGTTKIATPTPDGKPERFSYWIDQSIVFDNKVVFSSDDGDHGLEPWVTDGTPAGTSMMKDLSPAVRKTAINESASAGNGSYFAVDDGTDIALWRTNGTSGGTAVTHQFTGHYFGVSPTGVGSTLYFGGEDALWRTDGSAATKVRDLYGDVSTPVAFGNQLAFISTTSNQGYGLWLSDGTDAGTVQTDAINGRYLGVASGRLWLTALYGSLGNELWTSDGTTAGTHPVADIQPGFKDSKPSGFVSLGGKTIFAAATDATGSELFVTDGTEANTKLLADILPGATGSGPGYLTAVNGAVLMWARSVANGSLELWKTDGTTAGTVKVKPIQFATFASPFTVWGNYAFFAAKDDKGNELWRTDGTEAGTVRVADLNAGIDSSDPESLVLGGANGPLYFVASEPTHGREIWQLATPTGAPVLAIDASPGPRSSYPSHLQPKGASLIFAADDGNGVALFRAGAAPDVIAPTITCPSAKTVNATDASGAVVTFDLPDATDNNGDATVTTMPASGDVFPIGATTVTATATDENSNTATCTFVVNVTTDGSGSGSGSGSGGGGGGGGDDDGGDDSGGGGGCSTSGGGSLATSALLLGALLVRRRRR